MLTRVFRGTSRLAVASRVARRAGEGNIVGSKTVFDSRENALENKAVRDHENQLIEALRKELAVRTPYAILRIRFGVSTTPLRALRCANRRPILNFFCLF